MGCLSLFLWWGRGRFRQRGRDRNFDVRDALFGYLSDMLWPGIEPATEVPALDWN